MKEISEQLYIRPCPPLAYVDYGAIRLVFSEKDIPPCPLPLVSLCFLTFTDPGAIPAVPGAVYAAGPGLWPPVPKHSHCAPLRRH